MKLIEIRSVTLEEREFPSGKLTFSQISPKESLPCQIKFSPARTFLNFDSEGNPTLISILKLGTFEIGNELENVPTNTPNWSEKYSKS